MRIVDFLLNMLGWLQIVAATTAIGFIIGLAIYYFNHNVEFVAVWIISCISFFAGAVLATRIWIKHGSVNWLSVIRRIH